LALAYEGFGFGFGVGWCIVNDGMILLKLMVLAGYTPNMEVV